MSEGELNEGCVWGGGRECVQSWGDARNASEAEAASYGEALKS